MARESPSFDAYHKWLGIPPAEQPPHHYRLLAIQPFEADPDVIESAAEQRMAHVRARQTGRYSALSQKLLNEIAAAKIELLNSERKLAYDAQLRQTLAVPEPGFARDTMLPEHATFQLERSSGPVATARLVAPRNGKGWIVGVGAGLGVVTVGALAVVLVLSRPSSDISKTSPPRASKPSDKRFPQPVAPPPVVSDVPAIQGQDSPPAVPPAAIVSPPETRSEDALQNVPGVEPLLAKTPSAAIQATPDARSPVPDESALGKARQSVRDIYAQSFADAKSSEQKSQLAATIMKQGLETTDDPSGQYVLLDTARRMAEQGNDLELTLKICTHLADSFAVEAFSLEQSALDASVSLARKQADWQTIADVSLTLLEAAIAANDYEAAERFASTANESARKAQNKDLIARVTERTKEVTTLAAAYETAQDAFAKLQTGSGDPHSHLVAGKFLCFVKGDWSGGLVHLAKCSDESLAQLAQQDLDGAPNAAQWVALGDSWLASAEKAKEPEKREFQRRAAYWYGLALPTLTGLTQIKVEKLLTELPQAKDSLPLTSQPSQSSPWKAFAGRWKVTYDDGAVRHYSIDEQGTAVFLELHERATLSIRGRDIVLDFGDGKLERLSLTSGTLLVEHFNPALSYPNSPTLRGLGFKEAGVATNRIGEGLLIVFDDATIFPSFLDEGGGTAVVEEKDVYSGVAALKVTPDQRVASFLPGLCARIREKPGPGEYRYVRFAWKKVRGEIIGMQLHRIEYRGAKQPGSNWVRYHCGPSQTLMNGASVRVEDELPTEWTIVTRDLYADHGEFTLTGLALTPLDGEYGLFDEIYLARNRNDFDRVKQRTPRVGVREE